MKAICVLLLMFVSHQALAGKALRDLSQSTVRLDEVRGGGTLEITPYSANKGYVDSSIRGARCYKKSGAGLLGYLKRNNRNVSKALRGRPDLAARVKSTFSRHGSFKICKIRRDARPCRGFGNGWYILSKNKGLVMLLDKYGCR